MHNTKEDSVHFIYIYFYKGKSFEKDHTHPKQSL